MELSDKLKCPTLFFYAGNIIIGSQSVIYDYFDGIWQGGKGQTIKEVVDDIKEYLKLEHKGKGIVFTAFNRV